MNTKIQQKIEQYKEIAHRNLSSNPKSVKPKAAREDSLSKVIRSQKDGDNFIADVKNIIQRISK